MRLAVFLEQYEKGGVDTHLLNLITGWEAAEDSFDIYCNREHKGLGLITEQSTGRACIVTYDSVAYDCVKRKLPKPLRFLLYPFFPFFFCLQYLQAKKLLRDKSYDVLLADNGGYPGGWGVLASIIAARNLRIKRRTLLVHHAADPPRRLWGGFERAVDHAVARACTDIVAVSKATRETLIRHRRIASREAAIQVIYNSVSLASNANTDSDINLRRAYGIDAEFLIGMVGRVEQYKGQEDLIKGFADVPPALRDKMAVVIIGGGADTEVERLRSLAATLGIIDRIHFTGFLNGDPKSLISQLDLLVVLTRDFEGFGLTLGEAMAVDVPVLATSVGAIPEFIDSNCGVLIPPASPMHVTAALAEFASEPAPWRERSNNARRVINSFSVEKMARQFRNVFTR
ncbi:glycosyltransferase family 4 protein [Geomonas anaerohicana]|uniref:Glycosyltransferase family 4 protein n=1 Tax=Geomonas anaerohicana TaxID=2798583 RepID=A0ABS0YJY8_9BACT|nr:glycosyltransferase family 4 protein [Geomonas anaerohicana]MBJ6752192.1 glycosyltransferase family 4 protein [Geomonas anaerohicana]